MSDQPKPTVEWTAERLMEYFAVTGNDKTFKEICIEISVAITASIAAEREESKRARNEAKRFARLCRGFKADLAVEREKLAERHNRTQLAAAQQPLVDALTESKDVIYAVFHADKIDSRIRQWCSDSLRKVQSTLAKVKDVK